MDQGIAQDRAATVSQGREVNMANEVKLKWHELNAEMFPKNVQQAIADARKARQAAAELTAKADELLQSFAGRIQVPNLTGNMVPLVTDGLSMVISHRFGKLTVAAAPKEEKAKGKSKAVLA
jgi:hypothetical protein